MARIGKKTIKEIETSYENGRPCCPFCGYALKRGNRTDMYCVQENCPVGNKKVIGNFATWLTLFNQVKDNQIILSKGRTLRGENGERLLEYKTQLRDSIDSIKEAHKALNETIDAVYEILNQLHESRNKFEFFMAKEGVDL